MEFYERVWQRIDGLDGQLWDLAMKMYDSPEIGFEEVKAAAWLTEALEVGGFRVERGIADLPTAFRAVHPDEKEGPSIAIITEYDALPGLGHACGHNLVATATVGAALGLGAFKADLPGRLIVLGAPAEEEGGGKVLLVRAGYLKDVDAVLKVHPTSTNAVGRGSIGRTELLIGFHGRASHASTGPDKGLNALDAVVQFFVALGLLRQQIREGCRIHGIITSGGSKPNIIPEFAECRFYVRDADNAYREEVVEKLRHIAEGAALATGCRADFRRVGIDYKSMLPNQTMANAMKRYFDLFGYEIEDRGLGMASSDMGDVSWKAPTIHANYRITKERAANHTREFAEDVKSDLARKGTLFAAKAMAGTAIDLWLDPVLYANARAEFEAALKKA